MTKKSIILMNPLRLAPRFMSTNEFSLVWGPHPLVTLPLLAAMAPEGWDVKIIDPLVAPIKLKSFGAWLREADAVGITCTASSSALNTELTLKLVKKLKPEVQVIIGGHHATFYAEEWLGKGADIIIRGEGEYSFREVLERISENSGFDGVRGVSFASDGAVVHNPDRGFMDDLDSLPFPRWDLVDLRHYAQFTGGKGFTLAAETTRGCTNNCSFCLVNRMWKNIQRYRSVGKSIEDLKRLRAMGAGKLVFVGDGFGNPPDRHMELMKAMQKEKIDMEWLSFLRVDSVLREPALPREMAGAGCRGVFVGFESPYQHLLEIWEKGHEGSAKARTYREVYELLDREGILVFGFLIVGHPAEPAGAVGKIFKLHEQWCDMPLLNVVQPMKGTRDYDFYEKEDLLAKDMFYHDIRIPSLKVAHKNVYGALSLFARKTLFDFPRHVFSRKETKRLFFRHMYRFLAKKFLQTDLGEFRDYWNLLNFRKAAPAEMQDLLISRHLGNINALAARCINNSSHFL